ncbi:MAG: LSM1 protein [Piptocephalis tieghemiana]|nr:MAG: LSM1 protein [Piptocephalis tieghemiana]
MDPGQFFTTANSLLDCVDRRLVVVLRDGRKLFGVLRSYDQFANLVLQDTIERLLSPPLYSQTQRGVYIVRGENVVLLAEIDLLTEEETFSRMQLTSEQEVKAILDREAQERLEQSRVRNRVLRERGFSILDPPDTDNY